MLYNIEMNELLSPTSATMENAVAYLSYGMIVSAFMTFGALMFIPAPYGKHGEHASSLWGCKVPGRLAWTLQEIPSLAVPIIMLVWNDVRLTTIPWKNAILMAGFIIHYVNRSIIYPIQMKNPSGTPFVVFLMAFSFCTING